MSHSECRNLKRCMASLKDPETMLLNYSLSLPRPSITQRSVGIVKTKAHSHRAWERVSLKMKLREEMWKNKSFNSPLRKRLNKVRTQFNQLKLIRHSMGTKFQVLTPSANTSILSNAVAMTQKKIFLLKMKELITQTQKGSQTLSLWGSSLTTM